MSWQGLVAISVLTYSVSVLLQKLILKDNGNRPVAFSIIFQLLTGLLVFIFALSRGFSIPNLMPLLPNLLLMIIFYGAGNIFVFKALQVVEASEFTIVFSSRILWTVFAATIFLGEHFVTKQMMGTGFILSGVALVLYRKGLKFSRGTFLSFVAAAFFGLAFVNDAFIIRRFDVPSYLAIEFILPALAVWAVTPASTRDIRQMLRKEFLTKLCLVSLLYAVSAIAIFQAYQVGRNAAQIAPLSQLSTIITIFLAVIFLKEKSNLVRKAFAAVLSFIGIILVG